MGGSFREEERGDAKDLGQKHASSVEEKLQGQCVRRRVRSRRCGQRGESGHSAHAEFAGHCKGLWFFL